MKVFWSLFLAIISFASVWAGDEQRIAHVDSKIIFEKYKGTSDAQVEYDRKVAAWEQESNVLQKEVTAAEEKLTKQSLILSADRKVELEAEVAKRKTDLKNFIDRIYGPQGELVKENEKISAPIIEKIRLAINEVALQEGYDMVIDRASGALLFWKNEQDLTQAVLAELNKGIK
jgi:outer membrane protein